MTDAATAETDAPPTVRLTPSAARRVAEIVAHEGNPALMLRLTVSGGGCSGFQYAFSLDESVGDDAEVHYDDGLMAAHFTVRNPNATASCGCGTSFSVG